MVKVLKIEMVLLGTHIICFGLEMKETFSIGLLDTFLALCKHLYSQILSSLLLKSLRLQFSQLSNCIVSIPDKKRKIRVSESRQCNTNFDCNIL